MREAGYADGRVVIDMPGGARVTIEAGKASETGNTGDDIDAMIAKVPHAIP